MTAISRDLNKVMNVIGALTVQHEDVEAESSRPQNRMWKKAFRISGHYTSVSKLYSSDFSNDDRFYVASTHDRVSINGKGDSFEDAVAAFTEALNLVIDVDANRLRKSAEEVREKMAL